MVLWKYIKILRGLIHLWQLETQKRSLNLKIWKNCSMRSVTNTRRTYTIIGSSPINNFRTLESIKIREWSEGRILGTVWIESNPIDVERQKRKGFFCTALLLAMKSGSITLIQNVWISHGPKLMLCIWWDQFDIVYYNREHFKPNETFTAVQ